MNIYIGELIDDYSAMQGPCTDGFHIPLSTEWQGLDTIMTSLSLTTGDSWRINLHMPFVGSRGYYSADLGGQGSFGKYWSSSPYASSPSYASNLYLNSSSVKSYDYEGRASGLSVRCFKDSFELPTSSWTVVQGTLGSAGIFWNQTEGIISITSDGTTGYTIADKNLGATTVYNDGDTLSQANMGNMYQWGNNYGFPSTGSVSKTSSTQVNASTYGPGTTNGYYESDTCITRSSDRSSVRNNNLRGGVTGVVTKTKEVQNIYIGEYKQTGIYHNSTLGLISLSSDGTNRITIADKNLGATQVYNSGDTLSKANCGKYYQWGNNYGFPFSGSVTTSSTQVNAQNYGPGNYYSSSNFITVTSDGKWDSSGNQNLWGNTTNTLVARRGPCAEGYHIPSSTEFENIYTIGTNLGIATTSLYTYLKMGYSGIRFNTTGNVVGQGTYGAYWTSTPDASYLNWAYYADNRSDIAGVKNGARRGYGVHIRPFKNEAVQPDSSRTKLY